MLAVRRCVPLHIPAEFLASYNDWKELAVDFDPKEMGSAESSPRVGASSAGQGQASAPPVPTETRVVTTRSVLCRDQTHLTTLLQTPTGRPRRTLLDAFERTGDCSPVVPGMVATLAGAPVALAIPGQASGDEAIQAGLPDGRSGYLLTSAFATSRQEQTPAPVGMPRIPVERPARRFVEAMLSCSENARFPAKGPFSAPVSIEQNGDRLHGTRTNATGVDEVYDGRTDHGRVQLDGRGQRGGRARWRYRFSGALRQDAPTRLSGQMIEADRQGVEHADRACTMSLSL